MPPEQALGRVDELDERSDVFALGAILCEILTGAPPYPLGTEEAFRMAARCELDDAHARLDACEADHELVALCRAAMSPVPKDRPRNAAALADTVSSHLAAVDERAHRSRVQAIEQRERTARSRQQTEDAREAAEQQRRKRRRTVRVAAAALVVLLVGGGIGLGLDRARRDRVQGIVAAVEAALHEASRHRGAGNLDLAVAVAERAAELAAAPDAPGAVVREATALLTTVRGEAQAARNAAERVERDAAFVAELEDIRLRRIEDFDSRRTDKDYADAFQRHGIDVLQLAPAEAAPRIRGRTDPVALVAALDDWAWLRLAKKDELPEADAARLVEIARRADPDEWRNRLRAAVLRGNVAGLRKLAAEADVETLPPQTLDMLAVRLGDVDPTAAVALLRRACLRHPDDVWLSYHLNRHLIRLDPPDHDEARRFLLATAALRPCAMLMYMVAARSFDQFKDYEEAEAWARAAIRRDPDFALGHYALGLAVRNQGNPVDAESAYLKAIELDPRLAAAHVGLGALLSDDCGRYDEAIEEFRTAIELEPGRPRTYANLGIVLCKDGRPAEAVAPLRKSLDLDPECAAAHAQLGIALRRGLRDMAGSETELRKAIDLDPDFAYGHCELANTLRARKKLKEAIAAFRKSIELDPGKTQPRINLGALFCDDLRRYDDAIREFLKVTRIDPENATAWHNLGQVYGKIGKREQSIAAFREAIRCNPKYFSAHYFLGAQFFRKGTHDKAAASIERALPLAPNDFWRDACRQNAAGAYHNHSNEQLAAGDHKGTIESLRRAEQLDPKNLDVLNNLACLYMAASDESLRNYTEALDLAERAVDLQPENPDYVGLLGAALHLNGRHEETVERLRESIPAHTKAKSANAGRLFLAMALWKLGKRDEARKTLCEAEAWFAKNEPDDLFVQRFRAMAKEMIEPK
jgi:tetratricopeptide (TPR) repeat protein